MDFQSVDAKKTVSVGERYASLKKAYFSDESSLPNWLWVGPALLLWSLGVSLHVAPSSAIWLFPLLALGLISIAKFDRNGAIGTVAILAFAYLFQGLEVFSFFSLLSFALGLMITTFSFEELGATKVNQFEERESLVEERRLWKSRFDALNGKYEREKIETESQIEEGILRIESLDDRISSLNNLVDLSSHETEQLFNQNKELTAKNLDLLRQLSVGGTHETRALPPDDQLLYGLNQIVPKSLSSYMVYKNPPT